MLTARINARVSLHNPYVCINYFPECTIFPYCPQKPTSASHLESPLKLSAHIETFDVAPAPQRAVFRPKTHPRTPFLPPPGCVFVNVAFLCCHLFRHLCKHFIAFSCLLVFSIAHHPKGRVKENGSGSPGKARQLNACKCLVSPFVVFPVSFSLVYFFLYFKRISCAWWRVAN